MPALLILIALCTVPLALEDLQRAEVRDLVARAAGLVVGWLVLERAAGLLRVALEHRRYRRRLERIHAFARAIPAGVVEGRGAFGGSAMVVTGRLDGMPLRLLVRAGGVQPALQLELWAWNALMELEVTRAGQLARELEGAHASLPAGRAARALELDRAVSLLFERHGARWVTLRAGALRFEAPFAEAALAPAALEAAFRLLAQIARLVGRQEVEVRCVAGRAFALAGGGARLRCPYCKDDLDPAGLDVAACDVCRTAHHADCLAEGGGCTVLGCTAAPTGRGRVTAALDRGARRVG